MLLLSGHVYVLVISVRLLLLFAKPGREDAMPVLESPSPQQQAVEKHEYRDGGGGCGHGAEGTGCVAVVGILGETCAGEGYQEREEGGAQGGVRRGEGGG